MTDKLYSNTHFDSPLHTSHRIELFPLAKYASKEAALQEPELRGEYFIWGPYPTFILGGGGRAGNLGRQQNDYKSEPHGSP
jgi:hypothetical protein